MAILGYQTIGGSTRDHSDYIYAVAWTMPSDGDITSISVYGNSAAPDDITMGIYDDNGTAGAPGTLLRDTAGGASSTSPSWHTQNLDTPLSLLSGDRIYIAVHNNSDWTQYYDLNASADSTYRRFTGYTAGDLSGVTPDSFVQLSSSNVDWSIYLTFTPTGGGGSGGYSSIMSIVRAFSGAFSK